MGECYEAGEFGEECVGGVGEEGVGGEGGDGNWELGIGLSLYYSIWTWGYVPR